MLGVCVSVTELYNVLVIVFFVWFFCKYPSGNEAEMQMLLMIK